MIWEEISKDQDGFPVTISHKTEVCVTEKSVVRQEAYEAMRAGVNVSTVLQTRIEDWEETRHMKDGMLEYARKVKFNNCTYDIVRTYKTGKANIELVCG